MIKATFRNGSDVVEAIIDGGNLTFYDVSNGMITTIEGIKLSQAGVVKQFPDLEDDDEWKAKAIQRLKEHIKQYPSETQAITYVKDELIKLGYEPLFWQRGGHRPKKWRQ